MRLCRLVVRGFRNLDDLDCELPPGGVALFGANAQGKTNLLEAVYYPVLFRSVRGAPDQEVARFGGSGFHVEAHVDEGPVAKVAATWVASGRRKRIAVDDHEPERIAEAAGAWLAVAFLPSDVELAGGPAAERRRYLDRMLSLAHRQYLRALVRYRAALAQRNARLRQGDIELARAFDCAARRRGRGGGGEPSPLGGQTRQTCSPRARVHRRAGSARLRYRGSARSWRTPAAWPAALDTALARDRARGMTTVGPHRDDLIIELSGRPLAEYRIHRSAAECRGGAQAGRAGLAARRRGGRSPRCCWTTSSPSWTASGSGAWPDGCLSDGARQVFVTAPRTDELPPEADMPVWNLEAGRVIR